MATHGNAARFSLTLSAQAHSALCTSSLVLSPPFTLRTAATTQRITQRKERSTFPHSRPDPNKPAASAGGGEPAPGIAMQDARRTRWSTTSPRHAPSLPAPQPAASQKHTTSREGGQAASSPTQQSGSERRAARCGPGEAVAVARRGTAAQARKQSTRSGFCGAEKHRIAAPRRHA